MLPILSRGSMTSATGFKAIKGTRPRLYSKEDVAAGAVLRSISPKAFNLIRDRSWMQLPSRSTVLNWLSKFAVVEGGQPALIDLVKDKYPNAAAREVFLSFDEMSLKERWVYDKVGRIT